MKMTFNNYIQNPMGSKNAVFSQREVYRNLYTEKLDKIILREAGNLRFFLYKDSDFRYFIHIKVPSEVIKNFYYDTVIEFYTDDASVADEPSLDNYFVKFYSNDPAFVYTFAYSFLKNDIFIRDLVPRMSKQAVENAAKIKNPKNLVGYVKSLYFAYLIIKGRGLTKKIMFDTYGKKYDLKNMLNSVEKAEVKVAKRQEAEKELNKRKSINARKVQNTTHTQDGRIISSKNTNSVRSTAMINSANNTKFVKKTNIIKRK